MASVMNDIVALGLLIVLHCKIVIFQELCRQLSTLTETQIFLFTVFSGPITPTCSGTLTWRIKSLRIQLQNLISP